MARRGTTSAGAAQVAALATRRRKDYRVTPEQLVPEWRERAAALGLDAGRGPRARWARARGARTRRRPRSTSLLDRLGGPDGLTQRAVELHAARRAAGARARGCRPAPTSRSTRSSGSPIGSCGSERVVVLADRRRRGGGCAGSRRAASCRSVAERAAVLDARAAGARAAGARLRATAQAAGAAASRRRERRWSGRFGGGRRSPDEQAEMVRRLVLDGDGVAVVVGQAGTGKTFALAAAREAWEAQRLPRGRRGARAAGGAIELEDGAGIPEHERRRAARRSSGSGRSTRAAAAVGARDRRGRDGPDAGSSPSSSTTSERAGAKLVLVGDDRQLPEIGAGGAFGALARRLPAIELRENRRQAAAWEREALALLRDGDAEGAVRRYAERGRIVAGRGRRRGAAAAWSRTGGRRGDPDERGDDRPSAAWTSPT